MSNRIFSDIAPETDTPVESPDIATVNPKNRPAIRVIEENYQNFTRDPEFRAGLQGFDHAQLREAACAMTAATMELVNFHVLERSVKASKIKKGRLLPEVEANLSTRACRALEAYDRFCAALRDVFEMATKSGFAAAIDRHIEALCEYLEYNPKVLELIQDLKLAGILDAEISCVIEELRPKGFNIFRFRNSDGTFAGFVRFAFSVRAELEREHKLIERIGVPVLQGAGGGGAAGGVAAGVAILAAILCVITIFYL